MNPKFVPNSFSSSKFWRMFPAGMRRRWWLFRCFDLLVRYLPVLKKNKGLLVVRMDGIGDMVLFRRTLEDYERVFNVKKTDITVLGCKSWGAIGSIIFEGYGLRIIDEHAFARRVFYRFWVGLIARQIAPEITICDSYLRRAMMADSLVWMVNAPRSISSIPFINESTRAEYTYYLSQVDQLVDTGPYPTHEIIRHYQFLSEILGETIQPKLPKINWRDQPLQTVYDIQKSPYAVLNPGSNEYGRRWPFKNYLKIADYLRNEGLRVVIVGGKNEKVFDSHNDFNKDDIFDLSGKTELSQLLDIIKHATCVISNDTGPAHLSIALGTPTVVVVGGGHFGSFVPYPEEVRPSFVRFAFEDMSCYHCFWRCTERENNSEAFPCVSNVSVDTIWMTTKELLNAN